MSRMIDGTPIVTCPWMPDGACGGPGEPVRNAEGKLPDGQLRTLLGSDGKLITDGRLVMDAQITSTLAHVVVRNGELCIEGTGGPSFNICMSPPPGWKLVEEPKP